MRIKLSDNNTNQAAEQTSFTRQSILPLFQYANKTVGELCSENKNLLLFPHSFDETKGRIDDSVIFSIQNTSDPDIVKVETGNILGFFGVNGVLVKINSRFDQGECDYLLHYMLQRVFSFNLFNADDGIFDFLLFTFPYFIKAALQQGLYREYRRFQHNDSKIAGTIDVSRHIKENTPFKGNVSYNVREYSFDNSLTQLIRHTIEFIRTKPYGEAILAHDHETYEAVKLICDNTPSYDMGERHRVLQKNLRPTIHPYYSEYYPLQSLCVQILRMEEISFGENNDEICGILFDGAWLWEEYVNTVLDGRGFTHAENKENRGAIYLFEDITNTGRVRLSGRRYPDFYKSDFVLDAKYKQIGNLTQVSRIDRNDVHQVITYMHGLGVPNGGVVAPLRSAQMSVPSSTIAGQGGRFFIFGIEISKAQDYNAFVDEMHENEQTFLDSLRQCNCSMPA